MVLGSTLFWTPQGFGAGECPGGSSHCLTVELNMTQCFRLCFTCNPAAIRTGIGSFSSTQGRGKERQERQGVRGVRGSRGGREEGSREGRGDGCEGEAGAGWRGVEGRAGARAPPRGQPTPQMKKRLCFRPKERGPPPMPRLYSQKKGNAIPPGIYILMKKPRTCILLHIWASFILF